MTTMELVADGLRFPEGPVVTADGSVLVVEIRGQAVTRVFPDGRLERLLEVPGGPNGAAVGPDGRLYLCNNGGFSWTRREGLDIVSGRAEDWIGGSIQAADLATGALETLFTECDGRPLGAPNDLVFDGAGGIYFTDNASTYPRHHDRGGLYYISPGLDRITEVAFPLEHPNGVALSPDGSRVYVADTMTSALWYWDVESRGVLAHGPHAGGAHFLYRLPNVKTFDSIGVDAAGNIAAATLVEGSVVVVSPHGETVAVHDVPEPDPLTTNVAFGGTDMGTAFVTSGGRGRLYAMPWPGPGLQLNFNDVRLPRTDSAGAGEEADGAA
ncbi:SMP-30/gluconolactonase/LRE family protein [Actinomycetospora termitidis]|uniref:SMP-30/gluconolactonase/LRE family protein n=1 Tax=Actinomycetospora termitidis TaxID=3053470 RepID=A0ABT7M6D2_9PSEU|nr:SMP-30/gluconolactonase/LRE family protein [Actinomycetospora sp. Odt1-22]MDL5156231.1 SMP-30/gluconolactonase/LRE family protein [Actinomycetospora sp. Odt1-22]